MFLLCIQSFQYNIVSLCFLVFRCLQSVFVISICNLELSSFVFLFYLPSQSCLFISCPCTKFPSQFGLSVCYFDSRLSCVLCLVLLCLSAPFQPGVFISSASMSFVELSVRLCVRLFCMFLVSPHVVPGLCYINFNSNKAVVEFQTLSFESCNLGPILPETQRALTSCFFFTVHSLI